ncbi:hypothetical protein [Mesorhizobium sp.]|uniref:hypothetical protein n=2 Tax=unclassified Mesorhizobium TaxID=325217 RepID=UPI00257F0433|nr:hypothetical protein [Mesorhizobium sp.]
MARQIEFSCHLGGMVAQSPGVDGAETERVSGNTGILRGQGCIDGGDQECLGEGKPIEFDVSFCSDVMDVCKICDPDEEQWRIDDMILVTGERGEARREILYGIVKPNSRIQFSEAMPGDAKAIFYLADQAGLEGTVSKRADSKYRSGPTTNWLKTKSFTVDEFELLGVEREPGKAAFAL